ncbi:MAG: N-6 DNA methylase [Hyphomicrobiaceae bacterium]|nr:N-6 DNA methylase [Hyphomicrobiaceae bacterium]
MSTIEIIKSLVSTFRDNRDGYITSKFNETQTRLQFIDPMFAALGWDMHNVSGYAEAYKDVVHEDKLKVAGSSKSPDYSFRIGGARRFFLEAKNPSVNIKTDIEPAFQLRRYGWSAKLPLSVLTNFNELAVYDTRIRPYKADKASVGRVLHFSFEEYASRWDELAAIFSKEAVLKGSFDRYAGNNQRKGTTEVDEAFLDEIESWRAALAKNIVLRNGGISVVDLNFAVQRIIDRIVFLRIAEDRGIEPYGQLQKLTNGSKSYKQLAKVFERADARYNSGLFHFVKEAGFVEPPDTFTLGLTVDDKVIVDMISSLYPPESPYEFSVLPPDILGQVYEKFLGKVIRLAGKSAVIELKPEVRKAGGVYYTPSHIVDFIVRQTLAPLLEGKTPAQVSGARALRILDPSCGSGSFLIAAYQYLLDWYRRQYLADGATKHSRGKNAKVYLVKADEWRLTIMTKRQILLDHIFGVDIDSQAVEVTKLSLLLKLLEDESTDGLAAQLDMFRMRVLPDLGANIHCGNSLVASDLLTIEGYSGLDDDALRSINMFDWEKQTKFGDIIKFGGFDAVIGNPPYDVLEKDRGKSSWPHDILAGYVDGGGKLSAASGGKRNLFRFFAVKSTELLRLGGRFGMIMPMSLLGDVSCASTRSFLFQNAKDFSVRCFPQKDNASRRVFKDAKLSTAVYVFRKGAADGKLEVMVYPWDKFDDPADTCTVTLKDLQLIDAAVKPVPLCSQKDYDVCVAIHSRLSVVPFKQVKDLEIRRGEINQTIYRAFITSDPRHSRLLKGAEVGVYETYAEFSQSEREWFNEKQYEKEKKNTPQLLRRIATQRITGVDDSRRLTATIIDPPTYFADSTNSVSLRTGSPYALEYVLALLNSKLMQWRFRLTSTNNNVGTNEIEALPFRVIDFSVAAEKAAHDGIVDKVRDLIATKLKINGMAGDTTIFLRKCDAIERQIEAAIVSLYGLTSEQVAVVEAGAGARGSRHHSGEVTTTAAG